MSDKRDERMEALDETAGDVKISNAISVIKKKRIKDFFTRIARIETILLPDLDYYFILLKLKYLRQWELQLSPCCIKATVPLPKWTKQQKHSGGRDCIAYYGKNLKQALVA